MILLQWQHQLMLHKESRSQKEFQRVWLAFEADAAQHKVLVGEMANCLHLASFVLQRDITFTHTPVADGL